jgi:ABC-type transporter Mla subunit MlaD
MTEPGALSLDEVRARFLEAETRLTETTAAIKSIEGAAERLAGAREGVTEASQQLAVLAGSLGEVTSALTTNAQHLREGVDAIRLGDPAAIRRQIEELDSAFTAMQSVMGDRFGAIEAGLSEAKTSLDRDRAASRRFGALLAAAIILAIIVAAVIQVLI